MNKEIEMKIGTKLKVVSTGWWGHRANTYFYEVTALRKRNDGKFNLEQNYDYELTCTGFQEDGVGFISDKFNHIILNAKDISKEKWELLTKKDKEVRISLYWLTICQQKPVQTQNE